MKPFSEVSYSHTPSILILISFKRNGGRILVKKWLRLKSYCHPCYGLFFLSTLLLYGFFICSSSTWQSCILCFFHSCTEAILYMTNKYTTRYDSRVLQSINQSISQYLSSTSIVPLPPHTSRNLSLSSSTNSILSCLSQQPHLMNCLLYTSPSPRD